MSAQSVQINVVEYSDPALDGGSINPVNVDPAHSFSLPIDASNIETLAAVPSAGADLQGLLFYPALPPSDPCFNTAAKYVAKNVTSQSNVPNGIYPMIAIAPWISSQCMSSFMNVAYSFEETQGLLVYLPQDVQLGNFQNSTPPSANSPFWNINGGLGWQQQSNYAVVALNADNAQLLMTQMGLYSGNITQAPFGPYLTQKYGSQSIVRLFCSVSTSQSNTLPSLWVFLLIVLGVLLGMIGVTSVCMHTLQRHRRRHIRRRILAGDIDLEALGIKRLQVPPAILEKQRLIVFVADEDSVEKVASQRATSVPEGSKHSEQTPAESSSEKNSNNLESAKIAKDEKTPASSIEIAKQLPVDDQANLPPVDSLPHEHLSFSQPSCSICLEDFVSHHTIVRTLPCKHVYHPACIDPVLQEYSSLCPICKGSVLPAGYCPEITNRMVRRIRGLQRLRELEAARQSDDRVVTVHGRAASFSRQLGHPFSLQQRAARDVELRHVTRRTQSQATNAGTAAVTSTGSSAAAPPATLSPLGSGHLSVPITQTISSSTEGAARPADVSREEWARRRAQGMLAEALPAAEAERQADSARPMWRRVLGTVFPVVA